MATINLTVTGGGGWNAYTQTFPLNQNDGDDNTYQGWPGDAAGAQANYFNYAAIPDGAIISGIYCFGSYGAGSASATVNVYVYLNGYNTFLGTMGDVTSYGYGSGSRPGIGGAYTKADIQNVFFYFSSGQTGNANIMKLRSSALQVTYVLSGEIYIPIY